MTEYLFSYGTLQPDLAPKEIAPLVGQLRSVGRGYIRGFLYDFGEYPGAVLGETDLKVWGHVFALSENHNVLRGLDKYEEFNPLDLKNSQFVREKCSAVLEDGKAVEAWAYVYNRDPGPAPLIGGGDFAKSQNSKKQDLSKS